MTATQQKYQSEAMTKNNTTSLINSDECTAMSFAPIVSLHFFLFLLVVLAKSPARASYGSRSW